MSLGPCRIKRLKSSYLNILLFEISKGVPGNILSLMFHVEYAEKEGEATSYFLSLLCRKQLRSQLHHGLNICF